MLRLGPAAAGRRDRQAHVPEGADGVGIRRTDERDGGLDRQLLVLAAAVEPAGRRRPSASRPGTAPTAGVWSQIARYSYPRVRAASAISRTLALPSDHVVWQ